MAPDKREALLGRWVHSHEEDSGEELVFRPADRAFPPSRGRLAFELRPDGDYVETAPGPTDVPEESRGKWSLEGNRLVLEAEGNRPGHTWELAGAARDRLVLRRR
ncbi:MAG: hypothetical protein WD404_09245 [Solirubrobacterales bacterium]